MVKGAKQNLEEPSETADQGTTQTPRAQHLEATSSDSATSSTFTGTGPNAALTPRRVSVFRPAARQEVAARKYSLSVASVPEAADVSSLPKVPCFGATLSAAAQFSALMCYEDLIEEKITEAYPDRSWTLPKRCLTPEKTIVLQNLPEDAPAVGTPDSTVTKQTLPSPPVVDPESPSAASGAFLDISSGVAAENVPSKPLPAPVPAKQLNMTRRFQAAMDMLDNMKTTRGLLPTSPRVVDKYLMEVENSQPVDDCDSHVKNFKTWNSSWTKEFKL